MVGVLGALLFIIFVVGFSLMILIPTLLFTAAGAVVLWFWGIVGYTVLRWYTGKSLIVRSRDAEAKVVKDRQHGNQKALKGEEQTDLKSFSDVDSPKAFDEQVRARIAQQPSNENKREGPQQLDPWLRMDYARPIDFGNGLGVDTSYSKGDGTEGEKTDSGPFSEADWHNAFKEEVATNMEIQADEEARKGQLFNIKQSPNAESVLYEPETPTRNSSEGKKGKHLVITSTSPTQSQKRHQRSAGSNSTLNGPLSLIPNGVSTSSARTSNEL